MSPLVKKSAIVQFLNQIGDQEKHFNQLETEYRKMASTWLLAAMGACGYILASNNIPIDRWLLITAVGVVASVGIYVLYILDLNVYHQLLDAYFIEGVKLEVEHHDWLFPVRIRMLKSQNLKGVTGRVMYYYFISIALLIGISLFGIWSSAFIRQVWWCPWVITVTVIVGLVYLHRLMTTYSHNEEAIQLVEKYNKLKNITP